MTDDLVKTQRLRQCGKWMAGRKNEFERHRTPAFAGQAVTLRHIAGGADRQVGASVDQRIPGAAERFARQAYARAVTVPVEFGDQREIGRASCRERVCQYGVDLGGRRIIKKKKRLNKNNMKYNKKMSINKEQ